jgi:CMP-N-acetylneuraminic acid synthetase
MDDQNINVFLPMRANSERILNKNTRVFAGFEKGLCEIKIKQLLSCNSINTILISTDDPIVLEFCSKIDSNKINVIARPSDLATSSTSTDDLIKHVPSIMPEGHIMWTHVTSPFIGPDLYEKIIAAYFNNLDKFDSLMTVTKLQKFIWKNGKPINYDRGVEKWPRTQTLDPVWEVNSGAFIASSDIYIDNLDRIGKQPLLFELHGNQAFDIDWKEDFLAAEKLFSETIS